MWGDRVFYAATALGVGVSAGAMALLGLVWLVVPSGLQTPMKIALSKGAVGIEWGHGVMRLRSYAELPGGGEVVGIDYTALYPLNALLRLRYESPFYEVSQEGSCRFVYTRGSLLRQFAGYCAQAEPSPEISGVRDEGRRRMAQGAGP